MKITKNKLRKIIKEEKAKLLVEMNPIANAERMQGAYVNVGVMEQLERAMADLLAGADADALDDLGDEDEADDAATAALTITIAQSFQSLGLLEQYEALIRTLR